MAGTNSSYWGTSNSSTFESALSYVLEVPWNDSCASSLVSAYFQFTTSYGAEGFCGSTKANQDGLLNVVAGSGGPSGCATGAPDVRGVVGGGCQGYAKPAWQSGLAGIPNDGVRDIPDVSLFAGDGLWGHFYVFCYSDIRNGGASCSGAPSTWAGAGGTSFSSPIMAGVQALVNQQMNGTQGNPNYVYYTLAANASSVCDSTAGDPAGSPCIFHNVTQGDIVVNCVGTQNCFDASSTTVGRRGSSGGNGALSTSSQTYSPAYLTGSGWNFATGIGSIDAFNLVTNWSSGQ
jgi:hypothetical protein